MTLSQSVATDVYETACTHYILFLCKVWVWLELVTNICQWKLHFYCSDFCQLRAGDTIAELGVPGVKLSLLKRTYDTAVKLVVQDLYLVDRIQSFGPEYELIVCSSGKSMFPPSPIPDFTTKSPSSPSSPKQQTLSQSDITSPGASTPTSATADQSPVGEGSINKETEIGRAHV